TAVGQARDIEAWFETPTVSGQTNNAAVYFPRIKIPDPDPAAKGAAFETENSGTMAGIYAQTDAASGVWKAPAGIQTPLTGVLDPVVKIDDSLNGQLNPLGINCLRTFPVYGVVSWGARTIQGADLLESQWKYVNGRRLALYIEGSVKQGTTWAVFQPNDETLWSSLRLSVGAFMDGLHKQGAFAGTSAESSYFVACDASTTTPIDQQSGRVNVNVGFAPLYPAEFVVITISQIINQ
ncbi:MAG: phage tail sheath C-terminal domain-containing protein, partial [Pseudomonadota bacterium]